MSDHNTFPKLPFCTENKKGKVSLDTGVVSLLLLFRSSREDAFNGINCQRA